MTTALKLDKKGKPRLSEADVTKQVCDFLSYEGWRSVRMNVGGATYRTLTNETGWDSGGEVVDRYVQFGEPGQPDWLFIRYGRQNRDFSHARPWIRYAEKLLWIEFKAPGKKPSAGQIDWHEAERARGALVMVVDNYEVFRDWYRGAIAFPGMPQEQSAALRP